MKTFSDWLTVKKQSPEIQEGGGALTTPTTDIPGECIPPTFAAIESWLKSLLRVQDPDSAFRVIGSSRTRRPGEFAGDMDIAVRIDVVRNRFGEENQLDLAKKFATVVHNAFGEARVLMAGGIVSFPFGIRTPDHRQTGDLVQVDLMLVDDLRTAQFGFHSPFSKDSAYKGLYRNHLLFAIAHFHDREVLRDDGEYQIVRRTWFDTAKGLLHGIQRIRGKYKKVIEREITTRDPKEIVRILLGPEFSVHDADSFETLWNAIHDRRFIGRRDLQAIIGVCRQSLTRIKKPLPAELQ